MQIKVGDKAPLFEAATDQGTKFSMQEEIGKKNIVLYFYPKDMTSGCTAEACGFRDEWDKIVSLGATVIGVASQDEKSHQEFKKRNNLPFDLLVDQGGKIREMYGAKGFLIPSRVTFVIDKQGVVRFVFNSQLRVAKHVSEALKVLEKLSEKTTSAA
ncbi:MAG: peroxiredoxin [Nitrososphaerales archaeon]